MVEKTKIAKNFYVGDKEGFRKVNGYGESNQVAHNMLKEGKEDVIALITFGPVPKWLQPLLEK